MIEIEKLKAELGEYQAEHILVAKRKIYLRSRIDGLVKRIDSLEVKHGHVHPNMDLIIRDINLCINYIKNNTDVTSKLLVTHLNVQLMGERKRWEENKPLDANFFMGRIGTHLKKDSRIVFEKNTKGRGTVWFIQ